MIRAFLVIGLLAGCTRPSGVVACVTGDQKACPCLGGGEGVQVCRSDGSYGVCMCGSSGDAGHDEDGGDGGERDASVDDDGGVMDAAINDQGEDDFAVPPDLFTPDLSHPPSPDLAPFGGIPCAGEICSGDQICCLTGTATSGGCTSKLGCAQSSFSCDGPEDCPGQPCCVDVHSTSSSLTGSASCEASCPAQYSTETGGVHEQTRLCHSDADCTGLSGPLLGVGTFAYSSCCHSATTAPYHVCIPGTFAGTEGYTCP